MSLKKEDNNDGFELQRAEIEEFMGDIKVARFVIPNSYDIKDQSFFCSANNTLDSPNVVQILPAQQNETFLVGQWGNWTICEEGKVYRSKLTNKGESVQQERYCRCTDFKELPSPR